MDDLKENYKRATDLGIKVKAIVVINPGNPTGQVMSKQNLEDVIYLSSFSKIIINLDR